MVQENKSSSIFSSDGNYFDAYLDLTRSSDNIDAWIKYIWGYKMAADVLVNQLPESGYQDFMVFPICFLYLHYMELRLKQIIFSGRIFMGEPASFQGTHNINTLWDEAFNVINMACKIAVDLDSQNNIIELENAKHAVTEFSCFDSSAFFFRYPTDKKHQKLPINSNVVNIHKIARHVNAFADVMDSWGNILWEYSSDDYLGYY